jgi:hypothetical protein
MALSMRERAFRPALITAALGGHRQSRAHHRRTELTGALRIAASELLHGVHRGEVEPPTQPSSSTPRSCAACSCRRSALSRSLDSVGVAREMPRPTADGTSETAPDPGRIAAVESLLDLAHSQIAASLAR